MEALTFACPHILVPFVEKLMSDIGCLNWTKTEINGEIVFIITTEDDTAIPSFERIVKKVDKLWQILLKHERRFQPSLAMYSIIIWFVEWFSYRKSVPTTIWMREIVEEIAGHYSESNTDKFEIIALLD